jgi:glycosyltransferase involved in cell wall biosynthesis
MSDLLFISTNTYNGLPTRKQKFANYLKEMGFRILFVEPPYTYLALLKKGRNKKLSSKNTLDKIDNNFFLLHSFPWFPFFKKNRICNEIDNKIFLNHLKKAFKEIDFKPEIIWNYMPFLPSILQKIKSKKVYDCVDDHSAYPGLINQDFVNELERKTAKLSDLIITTNNELKEKIAKYGKDATIINNGVNWKFFSSNIINETVKINKRIIYVGAISEWFDKELVEFVAIEFPDYEITLIGPCSIKIGSLKNHKNIKLLGVMKQEAFAHILAESAIAIIPFKINMLTENVDPLKAYEYLATGVPVVSTKIGRVKDLPVFIGNNKEDFVSKIKQAIRSDSLEKRVERSLEVKKFAWEMKYNTIKKLLENLL